MASTRQSTSRYSLDDWESLAPLSTQEQQSVNKITATSGQAPVPAHVRPSLMYWEREHAHPDFLRRQLTKKDPLPLLPTTSVRSTPRPSSAFATRPLPANTAATETDPLALLSSLSPISTPQQFHDFHSLVEQSLEQHAELSYHSHLSTLSQHISTTTSLLENLDESRALLSELHANEQYVAENSSALQAACETMLDEQKHLLEVAEALTARLEYFRELERAVRLLNEPGEEVVLRPEFLEALDRVGVCLEYLRANVRPLPPPRKMEILTIKRRRRTQRDFVDSPLYLIRFQQCLTRSMTLIKMYFVSNIKRTGEEVRAKIQGKVRFFPFFLFFLPST
jgi:hypothetical protein